MKIRTDFVTNSSSSSFILGFQDEQEIYELASELPDYWKSEVVDGVINEVLQGVVPKEEAKCMISRCGYSSIDLLERIEENSVLSIVTYGDETKLESELQYEIMPKLSATIQKISNH